MKNSKIVIVLTTLALIIIPVSIKAVSTIIEKVKVVPDVPEPILQNVPEEAYIRHSNDIFEEETVFSPEFGEKLRKSEEENEARNKKIEEIINSQPENAKVAFVGDGINDAPVLTRSDIGRSMGAKWTNIFKK